jgi:hypothetical protein
MNRRSEERQRTSISPLPLSPALLSELEVEVFEGLFQPPHLLPVVNDLSTLVRLKSVT